MKSIVPPSVRIWLAVSASCVLFTLGACGPKPSAEAPDEASQAAKTLHALFDEEWDFRLRESPLFATSMGDHRYDDRLPSVGPEDLERQNAERLEFLDRLESIDYDDLDPSDRISARMFERQLRHAVNSYELGGYRMPINADYGFHMGFASFPRGLALRTVEDYENYIARLNASPVYFEQQIGHLRTAVNDGFVQPRESMEGYEQTIAAHVVSNPEDSVFWEPFAEIADSVPAAEHERLRNAGRQAIEEAVVPAFESFRQFFVNDYMPSARETFGISEVPGGREYYEEEIRWYTTTDLTPEEIHEIGRGEVARIRSEMEEIIASTGFDGDFPAFLEFLRTDPRFYPETAEDLLKEASYIAKRMDGKLPALFKTMPRLPYTVEPVPEHIAPKFTAGRYVGAPIGSTRPGAYWVNTSKLESRSLYTLEALSLHEAVPGHHFQAALSRELDDLPKFRRHSYISAFGEGWGLYSEWLGLEAGFYTDPYSNFGRLTYEMWRACRLVVDTGVHAMGWTRQQVLDFMAENTALSLHEVETETDRYITWPAQALSYKMGEIRIKELRKRAEEELGPNFDVREFHDAVLLQGSVPLDVLDDQIDSYITRAKQAAG